MVLHSFALTVDATLTTAQMKSAIDSFLSANGVTDTNIKTCTVARSAHRSEQLIVTVLAAI